MKLVAIAATLLAVSALASADSLKAVTQKMGDKASSALAHKDFNGFAAAIKSCVTKDFKYTEQGRSMGLAKMIEGVKQGVGPLNVSGAKYKVLSCSEHGKSGTATTQHTLFATIPGPDKKPHKLMAQITSKDTWLKVGGAWKMSSMVVVSQKLTRDNKPFNPMGGKPGQVQPTAK